MPIPRLRLVAPVLQRCAGLALATVAALLLGACGGRYTFHGTVYDPPLPAPGLTGTNWDDTTFAIGDLRGKVVMLFFGYTACPDICPLALSDMVQVKQQLGSHAADVAFVFVTLDPERDTPERVGAYLRAFDAAFYGVFIPLDRLDRVRSSYGVYAKKRLLDPADSAAGYVIDHSGWTYLIDKEGNLRALFDIETSIDQMVEDVEYLAGSP